MQSSIIICANQMARLTPAARQPRRPRQMALGVYRMNLSLTILDRSRQSSLPKNTAASKFPDIPWMRALLE